MPAESFKFYKAFAPPDHCIEDKTSSQLNAMVYNRYEGTLEQIMALWWNLYTFDFQLYNPDTAQTVSGATEPMTGLLNTDPYNWVAVTPKQRVDLATFGESLVENAPLLLTKSIPDTFFTSDETGSFWIGFQRVYFNTTTQKYALMFQVGLYSAKGWYFCTVNQNLDTAMSSNCTAGTTLENSFLGIQLYLFRDPSLISNVLCIISNPVYFEY